LGGGDLRNADGGIESGGGAFAGGGSTESEVWRGAGMAGGMVFAAGNDQTRAGGDGGGTYSGTGECWV